MRMKACLCVCIDLYVQTYIHTYSHTYIRQKRKVAYIQVQTVQTQLRLCT